MKFLKRIVARWAREGREADENYEDRKYPEVGRGSARGLTKKNVSSYYGDQGEGAEFKNPMNITLYNAVGGRIVRFSRWDRANDTTQETTYVVDSSEDFEKALASFIALEALKHVE